MDTIFALASARGKAGVAVVRVSGPLAGDAVRALAGDLPPPREARLRRLRDGFEVVDEGLVLWFPGPGSFTGEDMAEFQVHGSAAVTGRLLRLLGSMGLRTAEPGEFTRRAMENGRLDLAQVEGLADLIDAETEAQRVQAMRALTGALGLRVAGWRGALLRVEALVAASIDFADEDLPDDVLAEAAGVLDRLIADLRVEVEGVAMAERLRDGFEVAILGVPNAGKSTLLNAIAGREAALTSAVPGTTRDVIEVRMDLGGLPVTLLDTAGLRETGDEVEAMGVARALARAEAADLRVFLTDAGRMPEGIAPREGDLVVPGKADLGGEGVSGLTGAGVAELLDRVQRVLAQRAAGAGVMTRERHRRAMERAIGALARARSALHQAPIQPEILGEHLRQATRALESLIGKVDVEDVLGEVFARFCIGK